MVGIDARKRNRRRYRSAFPKPVEGGKESSSWKKSYRTVMLFYKNTDSDKIRELYLHRERFDGPKLTDLDNSFFIDAIANGLRANYDRLDLRTNYSLLVDDVYSRVFGFQQGID